MIRRRPAIPASPTPEWTAERRSAHIEQAKALIDDERFSDAQLILATIIAEDRSAEASSGLTFINLGD